MTDTDLDTLPHSWPDDDDDDDDVSLDGSSLDRHRQKGLPK